MRTDCGCEERDWSCKGCWARYRRERRADGKDISVRFQGRITTAASVLRTLERSKT